MSGHDPFDLRGQERKAEDDKQQDRLTRETEEGDVQWLMSSKRGRRIVCCNVISNHEKEGELTMYGKKPKPPSRPKPRKR